MPFSSPPGDLWSLTNRTAHADLSKGTSGALVPNETFTVIGDKGTTETKGTVISI